MLLLDKGYFDYDFEKTGPDENVVDWLDTVKTDEEVAEMLSGFGFGIGPKKPETLEDIQNHIIKQESYGS